MNLTVRAAISTGPGEGFCLVLLESQEIAHMSQWFKVEPPELVRGNKIVNVLKQGYLHMVDL